MQPIRDVSDVQDVGDAVRVVLASLQVERPIAARRWGAKPDPAPFRGLDVRPEPILKTHPTWMTAKRMRRRTPANAIVPIPTPTLRIAEASIHSTTNERRGAEPTLPHAADSFAAWIFFRCLWTAWVEMSRMRAMSRGDLPSAVRTLTTVRVGDSETSGVRSITA